MEFQVVLVEGVFDQQGGEYLVRSDAVSPAKSVHDELKPMVDTRIRVALHHLPPDLGDLEGKWGGGSCLWQPSPCPAGHHERPGYLLNVTGEGILRYSEQRRLWRIDRLDGSNFVLPFELMVGHYGRLAAATLLDIEKMRDELTLDDLDSVESLGTKLESVKELLEQLRRMT